MTRIVILGGGSWGVALAQLCAAQGHETRLWARSDEVISGINGAHRSDALPGIALDPRLVGSTDMAILGGADAVLVVVPAQAARQVLERASAHMDPGTPLVLCQKGVERGTLALPDAVARVAAPRHPLAVLTGPSFAADVARGLPTAVAIAAETLPLATTLSDMLSTPTFRPYSTDDLTGAQIGGALKNVLAIACGIVVAQGLGESARAAIVARGFAEMTRLAQAMGGRAETVAGLSGLGDLVLTCGSAQSRNFSLGLRLGSRTEDEAGATVEGAATAAGAVALGRQNEVEMPICETVSDIIEGTVTIPQAVDRLLQRPRPPRE